MDEMIYSEEDVAHAIADIESIDRVSLSEYNMEVGSVTFRNDYHQYWTQMRFSSIMDIHSKILEMKRNPAKAILYLKDEGDFVRMYARQAVRGGMEDL